MKTLHLSALAVFLTFSGSPAHAQRDMSKVEIKTTAVAGNIHMLEGQGGNIAVSTGPDGVLMALTLVIVAAITSPDFTGLSNKNQPINSATTITKIKPRFILAIRS